MKKLLDETTDDLTRALLEAGRSHRPPSTNHAKLLVALGVGAGVGLFSAKAFAWLGTSAGKLTLLGVSVGIAGAVYSALPERAEVARVEAQLSPVAMLPSAHAAAASASAAARPATPAAVAAGPSSSPIVPALVADAPPHPRPDSVLSSRVANGSVRREHAPAASELPRRASKAGKRSAARRDDVVEPLERLAEGPLPAASILPPAVGALNPGEAPNPPEALNPPEAVEVRLSGLESEIQLVDAMRGAAQRNDAPGLRRLVDNYRGAFPDGQLRQEVSELALRALPTPAR
jgi:hypothetical protein